MFFRPRTLAQAKRQASIMWISFIIAQFLFIWFANLPARLGPRINFKIIHVTNISPFIYLFSFMAIISIAFGLYLYRRPPKVFLKRELKGLADRRDDPSPEFRDLLMARATFLYFPMTAAYFGSCGCYGVFLLSIGGNPAIIYPFAALGIAGLIFCGPTKAYYERVAQRVREWQNPQNQ